MEKDHYRNLLDYALRLLGGKSYTEQEMREKLVRRSEKIGLSGADGFVAKAMSRLSELGLINDAKILENYFEYRLATRPVGKFLFIHEMHRRGIPIKEATAEWEKRGVSERELAKNFLAKKHSKVADLPSFLRRKKTAQLLASRGFSPETVWHVVDGLLSK